MAYRNGLIRPSTKDNGIITKQKVKEYFGILKVIFILETLEMIKLTVLEYINTLMEADTRVNGLMTFNKDKEKKSGLMELNT